MFLSLGKFHPLNDLEAMRREMAGVLGEVLGAGTQPFNEVDSADKESVAQKAATPAIDIFELDTEILITAELPGVKKDDLELTLKENSLHLKAKITANIDAPAIARRYSERGYDAYERTLKIPLKVSEDNIKAVLKDGLLTITIPKAIELQTKKIAVEAQ